ncbi:nuclear transport factor 2 family protein [Bacillus sonorensis]|uniref:SnoaL-like domain-containing protein n=2 Tax=Bacillus sonorensis TaxID=119858 RepID=M5NZH4_9BACI|nr:MULTISPECIES: nuclear transport factor 2 family protein [Bacillus]TWK84138.1 putative PhzA/B-like protein [Bacillus paralicheniformis]ASB89452.1 uncharacterized protein S101395_02945 [Bacillus sonorensis]EME72568.1 hypothetical protein BSONL12_21719 [Bacillus sonorensis L12]MBG9915169.1 hypothetical protein [Bacillus sonorensis]MCY7858952.1 nuclear transport factor 2 family protein [Bacillus sonorensis]
MSISITKVIERFLDSMLEKDMKKWIELWDDQAVFEFPYAPAGFPEKIEGKSAIYDYIKDFPEKIDIVRFTPPVIYQIPDSNTAIAEFECEGTVISMGLPYKQKYISVIKTKDGKIVHYKDYWNPLTVIEAFGGQPESFLAPVQNDDQYKECGK